jgi:hypothetical protein
MLITLTAGVALFATADTLFHQFASRSDGESQAKPTETISGPAVAQAVPSAVPRVATDKTDSLGKPITISCASCHANFQPNAAIRSGEQLVEFHQGLIFSHGKLTCLSCHHSKNYNLLRLANEEPLEYSQTQVLCSQCHSKQNTDYEHGAHGGMNGHWNIERGTRVRKRCIDCHDPHSPSFPAMVPTFRSHDRFLKPDSKKTSRLDHE